jgi:uncharacterized protein with PIN domain
MKDDTRSEFVEEGKVELHDDQLKEVTGGAEYKYDEHNPMMTMNQVCPYCGSTKAKKTGKRVAWYVRTPVTQEVYDIKMQCKKCKGYYYILAEESNVPHYEKYFVRD